MPKAGLISSHLHSNLQSKHGTRFSRGSGHDCWLCFEEIEVSFDFQNFLNFTSYSVTALTHVIHA